MRRLVALKGVMEGIDPSCTMGKLSSGQTKRRGINYVHDLTSRIRLFCFDVGFTKGHTIK